MAQRVIVNWEDLVRLSDECSAMYNTLTPIITMKMLEPYHKMVDDRAQLMRKRLGGLRKRNTGQHTKIERLTAEVMELDGELEIVASHNLQLEKQNESLKQFLRDAGEYIEWERGYEDE